MATRLDVITEAYLLATGKTTLPSVGSAKRNQLNALATKYYREIQIEPGVEWDWLYDIVSAGTVTATDTFELADEINFISNDGQRENNFVRVLKDGQYIDFKTCTQQQLYKNRLHNYVAKIGDNSIKFSKAFTAEDQAFGGTIQVPAILKLADITTDDDDVLIPNPAVLTARVAAQYAFSYKSLRDMYDDLLDQYNELLQAMIDRNTSGNDSTSTGVDYFASMGNVH